MILSPDDLVELTGKAKPRSQATVLDALGIPHRQRPDRSLVVLRVAVQVALGHHEAVTHHQSRPQLRLPTRHEAAKN